MFDVTKERRGGERSFLDYFRESDKTEQVHPTSLFLSLCCSKLFSTRNMYSIHLAQLTNSKLMTPSCVNALIARIFPLDRAKEVLLKMPLVKP
jgi:hypothetical protein